MKVLSSNYHLINKIISQAAVSVLSVLAIIDLLDLPLFSNIWKVVFAVCILFYVVINIITYLVLFKKIDISNLRLFRNRTKGNIRWAVSFFFIGLITVFLLFTRTGSYFQGDYFRLSVYLIATLVVGFLICGSKKNDVDWPSILLASGMVAVLYAVGNYLTDVSPNPFSYSWSEGNRFYDYSLIFGKYLYNYSGVLEPNYDSPGRYGLWGIWFLVPGLPIIFHRFWNAILWTVTPFILGYYTTKKIEIPWLRWGMILWFTLFIMVGPVYPTLLVSLIILAATMWSEKFWLRGAGVALATIFAGLSRYFWVIVPGAWIVLVDLFFYYPKRTGKWYERLLPTLLIGILGVIPGSYFGLKQIFSPKTPFEMHQPLLWYRLLPNATYPLGIILNFLIGFSPIILLLIWLVLQKKIRMDLWQTLAVSTSLVGFAIAGFIASTKIGGGSNLHNLDMFIVTMGLISVILVTVFSQEKSFNVQTWPKWILIVGVIVMLTPGWIAMRTGSIRIDPPVEVSQGILDLIQAETTRAQLKGEVLFMDQRQLLAFHNINNIRLIPEYEKKYMMDQAMGDNSYYFEQFHKDLANHRFTMIVTDTLTTDIQKETRGFSEENNAYVRWVANPIVEYYRPLYTIKEIGVQLLIPR